MTYQEYVSGSPIRLVLSLSISLSILFLAVFIFLIDNISDTLGAEGTTDSSPGLIIAKVNQIDLWQPVRNL